MKRLRRLLVSGAAWVCVAGSAFAQTGGAAGVPVYPPAATSSSPSSACPAPAQVTHLHLYGLWRAEFPGQAQGASLLFEKHPEYPESVRGGINRDGARGMVAGDVEDGELNLDESTDGLSIAAAWSGLVVANSCGKEIRGTWTPAAGEPVLDFILRKVPGWQ
ncbi:MAG: hypothetical protein H7332_00590 [Bdellovibrionales bacterium]|nr:hypothetical protein [Ramlibacter sp.]